MEAETKNCLESRCKVGPIQEILRRNWNIDNQQYECITLMHPSLEFLHSSNISIITNHLVLTSAASICPEVIDILGITNVISCAFELPDIPQDSKISYHKVNVTDSPNSDLSDYFDWISDLIHQVASLRGRTLIFCVAGVSRSATLCIAYLMKYHSLTLLEAYNYLKLRRPKIRPNCGFFLQLIAFEKKLFPSNTVSMVFNEIVQMAIPEVYDDEYKAVRSIRYKVRMDKSRF